MNLYNFPELALFLLCACLVPLGGTSLKFNQNEESEPFVITADRDHVLPVRNKRNAGKNATVVTV